MRYACGALLGAALGVVLAVAAIRMPQNADDVAALGHIAAMCGAFVAVLGVGIENDRAIRRN